MRSSGKNVIYVIQYEPLFNLGDTFLVHILKHAMCTESGVERQTDECSKDTVTNC